MTYTFDQMMNGEGLPEQNFRHAFKGGHKAVTPADRDNAITLVKQRFPERYGVEADTVEAAESGGDFVCMAYRIAP